MIPCTHVWAFDGEGASAFSQCNVLSCVYIQSLHDEVGVCLLRIYAHMHTRAHSYTCIFIHGNRYSMLLV